MKYNVTLNGKAYEVVVEKGEARVLSVGAASPVQAAAPTPAAAPVPAAAPSAPADGKSVAAPMPGTVLAVKTSVNASVKEGDILLVLEAMKMENDIVAPSDGTVAAILVQKGSQVDTGAPLIVLK